MVLSSASEAPPFPTLNRKSACFRPNWRGRAWHCESLEKEIISPSLRGGLSFFEGWEKRQDLLNFGHFHQRPDPVLHGH